MRDLVTTTQAALPLAHVLPVSATLTGEGTLAVGGCDLAALAREYGTPLYAYDHATLRAQCRGFLDAFRSEYPETDAVYAAKAFLNRPFAQLIAAEGYGFDAVSGGEIAVLRASGVDMSTVYFHGNNKGPDELALAIEAGVGRVVIDNIDEIGVLEAVAAEAGATQSVLVRLSPGVDAYTHEKTTTGILDTKFGIPIATGAAEQALQAIAEADHIYFRGLHVHLGSPIFRLDPYVLAIEVIAEFWADVVRDKLGLDVPELSIGGGFAIAYRGEQEPPERCAARPAREGSRCRGSPSSRAARLSRARASRSTRSARARRCRASAPTSRSTAAWPTTSDPRCTTRRTRSCPSSARSTRPRRP